MIERPGKIILSEFSPFRPSSSNTSWELAKNTTKNFSRRGSPASRAWPKLKRKTKMANTNCRPSPGPPS